MARPTDPYLRFSFGGAMYGSDQWRCTISYANMVPTGNPTQAQMNTLCGTMLGHTATMWTALKAKNASGVFLGTAQLWYYDGGNLMQTGSASITPVAGTASGPMPAYVSRCVTFYTAQPGRSRRGRMYLPWTADAINAGTGLWATDSTVLPALWTMAGAHITDIASQTPFTVAGSQVIVSEAHGYLTTVTSYRMDNRPDTQHGRVNKLVPTVFNVQP